VLSDAERSVSGQTPYLLNSLIRSHILSANPCFFKDAAKIPSVISIDFTARKKSILLPVSVSLESECGRKRRIIW